MSFEIFHAAVSQRNYPEKNINILLNAVENGATDSGVSATRNLLQMIKPRSTILDSGGSTIHAAEKAGKVILSDPDLSVYKSDETKLNLTPEHVIRAAVALKPTAMVSLDWPLQKRNGERDDEFRKKLPVNLDWAKETARLRQKYVPEIRLLIPVQARDLDQFEEFMEGLSGLAFTGVSLPHRNLTPELLIQYLVRLWQLRVPWVHILGTTCFAYLGIAAYFARQEFFKMVTMDSTTWFVNGNRASSFMSPHNLLRCNINEDTWIPESLRNDCSCPFCRNVSFQDMAFARYSSRSVFLCCHNAWVTEMVARQLYKNAKTLEQLTTYMMNKKAMNDMKVRKAMDALFVAQRQYGFEMG